MTRRITEMQRRRRQQGAPDARGSDEAMGRLYPFVFPELDLLRQHYRAPHPPPQFEDRLLARLVTDASTGIVRRTVEDAGVEADTGGDASPLPGPSRLATGAPSDADGLLEFVEGRRLFQRATGTPSVARGTVLARRYRIARLLSCSSSGELYEAVDLENGKRLALKLLGAELCGRQGLMIELQRVVERMSRFSHANVCRVHHCAAASESSAGSSLFLAMELVRGHSLRDHVHTMGPLPASKGLALARQLLQALSAAHGCGMTHGDLGSESVWLWCPRIRGGSLPFRAVIMDFGLTAALNEIRGLGKRHDRSVSDGPEAGESVAIQADLFAFGALMFEALTGQAPFIRAQQPHLAPADLPIPSELRRGVSRELDELVLRCSGRDPKRRYRSASAALMDLERCATVADERGPT